MGSPNYFDVLGLDPEATAGEIKRAYRKQVLKYHPDRNPSQEARKKYINITEAYEVLIDPVKRDEQVRGQINAVTDDPWGLLEGYWKLIYEKGIQ